MRDWKKSSLLMPSVIEGYAKPSIFFAIRRMCEWSTTTNGNMKTRTTWESSTRKRCGAKTRIIVSERYTARAAAGCSTPTLKLRSIACILCAAITGIKRSWNGGVRRSVKIASARPAANPLRPSGRMLSSAAMPADRKHTGIALQIMKSAKLTPWRKRNGNQKNVTDAASGHADHLQQA